MTLPEISDRVWRLAHKAGALRGEIHRLAEEADRNGALPADVAGLLAHLRRVALAVEADDPEAPLDDGLRPW